MQMCQIGMIGAEPQGSEIPVGHQIEANGGPHEPPPPHPIPHPPPFKHGPYLGVTKSKSPHEYWVNPCIIAKLTHQ